MRSKAASVVRHVCGIAVLVGGLLAAWSARAEVFKYEDADGVIHFVDSPHAIPPEFRKKVVPVKDTAQEQLGVVVEAHLRSLRLAAPKTTAKKDSGDPSEGKESTRRKAKATPAENVAKTTAERIAATLLRSPTATVRVTSSRALAESEFVERSRADVWNAGRYESGPMPRDREGTFEARTAYLLTVEIDAPQVTAQPVAFEVLGARLMKQVARWADDYGTGYKRRKRFVERNFAWEYIGALEPLFDPWALPPELRALYETTALPVRDASVPSEMDSLEPE